MSACDFSRCRAVLAAILPYGREDWWPGDTEEVMIGVVLTQQTRWEYVDRALIQMKEHGVATLPAIAQAEGSVLEELIGCTGFYRVKARRLRALARHVCRRPGGLPGMAAEPTGSLRDELLGIEGIGEETAECILCFGFGRAVFVMDAYTSRICTCAGIHARRNTLRDMIAQELGDEMVRFRRAHAAFVEYGRIFCAGRRCAECRIPQSNA
jgi:endonuclease-3 related protein